MMNEQMNSVDSYQPTYSYVNKKLHCYTCNRDFKQMVRALEGASWPVCKGEFVEEVTRDTSEEIYHFTPYVIRSEERKQEIPQERPRIEVRTTPTVTYVTQTITPDGRVITRRVTSNSGRSGDASLRANPNAMFDSFFMMPFDSPFSMFGPTRFVSLDDIITLSMREAGIQGVPPAPEEAISKLEEVEVNKDEEWQCSICMDKINGKGLKLPCGHVFDRECVTTWLKQHDSCPVCRKGIQQTSS